MASSYTLAETVEIITNGENAEQLRDVGSKYPILAALIAKVGAKAGNDFVELMSYIPDYITANKVNSIIRKRLFDEGDNDSDGGDEKEKPKRDYSKQTAALAKAREAKKAAAAAKDFPDYDDMSPKELWAILKENDATDTAKSKSKEDLLKAVKALFAKKSTKADETPKKKAGRPAKKVEEPEPDEVDEDEEDWEDDEEEDEKPVKKSSKKASKSDDDDWDI